MIAPVFVLILAFFPSFADYSDGSSSACWESIQKIDIDKKRLISALFDSSGKLNQEFVGKEGYARFAKKYTDSNMLKAFKLVSAVLDKSLFLKLGWQAFLGTVSEYKTLKPKILNKKGEIKQEFVGREGYARFAKQHFNSIMLKTFINVSAVLDKDLFLKLGWQAFQGTVSEYKTLKPKILNETGEIKQEFIGREGYARFAKKHFRSNMTKTFVNVSAVLDKDLFLKLNWQTFQGTAREYIELRSKILNETGEIKQEFIGREGYARFAEKHSKSNMKKAFVNVSAVLDKDLFLKLNWQTFRGTASEYRELRSKILNEKGEIKQEFAGGEGYVRFAEKHFKTNMTKTFINVSAILDKSLFLKLNWQKFEGMSSEYRELRSKILNERGEIKQEFVGIEGHARFAKQYTHSRLLKAFKHLSAILEKTLFKKLEWKFIRGTADQFYKLREDFIENYPQLYEGLENQKRVADKIFKGDTKIVYGNMSALREYFFEKGEQHGTWIKNRAFQNLNWLNQ